MKRWNKTVMAWDFPHCGIQTDIPITDWKDRREKLFHTLHELRMTSLPDRSGFIELEIRRCIISPTTQRHVVIQRLTSLSQKGRMVQVNKPLGQCFSVTFQLLPRESFCETALSLAQDIFSCFKIEEEIGAWITNFYIRQETFFRLDGKWVVYADVLRTQQGLRQICVPCMNKDRLFEPSNSNLPLPG